MSQEVIRAITEPFSILSPATSLHCLPALVKTKSIGIPRRTSATLRYRSQYGSLAKKSEAGPTGKRFNLQGACLVDIDLRDEVGTVTGLRGARLANAIMLRADFTNADLSDADLKMIKASDYLQYKDGKKGWTPEIGYQLNRGVDGDTRGAIDYSNETERHQFITFFVGANLAKADFQDAEIAAADFTNADLSGAHFLHANISRTRFVGAKNMTVEQMKKACVDIPGMDQEELKKEQPYFRLGFESFWDRREFRIARRATIIHPTKKGSRDRTAGCATEGRISQKQLG